MIESTENIYLKELKKFEKKKVSATGFLGSEVVTIEGELRGINYSTLSCVVMTDKEKVIMKSPIIIRRKRDAD